MASALRASDLRGQSLEVELAPGKVARVMITNVSPYVLKPEPEKTVQMYNIEFSGVMDTASVGPWFVGVDASKATLENIKVAVGQTIKSMLGI
jgi:hypothetical protein